MKTVPFDTKFPSIFTSRLTQNGFQQPYTQQWNLTVERQLPGEWMGVVSYSRLQRDQSLCQLAGELRQLYPRAERRHPELRRNRRDGSRFAPDSVRAEAAILGGACQLARSFRSAPRLR